MSAVTFLASSRPFIIPDDIQEYNNGSVFESREDFINLWVSEVDTYGWGKCVEGIFTLPYLYEISDANNRLFLLYLERYMEIGDVLELLHIPNQHDFSYYKKRLMGTPEPININVGSLTYQDKSGTYLLKANSWVEELSHKIYLSEHGLTTIVKY
ncbi:hypothetical protein [Gracilibacillus alcaliphilus]|uniref:hypothetical protein n=1 Tax=Gracilibacillus alcaliphilus TaxID=1401441 RepID=UPI00195ED886|nr:hypothetical protein [Gracilibacillus alcaliphilus]MBM7679625.1 hypothetical protein [Gracilibacillus alcaliphilus]